MRGAEELETLGGAEELETLGAGSGTSVVDEEVALLGSAWTFTEVGSLLEGTAEK